MRVCSVCGAAMNEQKARRLRRVECAHSRFAGTLLAVGMPPSSARLIRYLWDDSTYRTRVAQFYLASFGSHEKPSLKTVDKFVRSYLRWLRHQNGLARRNYE